MGLDTSHNCWHGAYSSFMEWRIWLAEKIGISLREMEGYRSLKETENSKLWKDVKDDLKILLNHSDCDGHITWRRAGKLSKRLFKLMAEHGKDPEVVRGYDILSMEPGHNWFWVKTLQFAEGARRAFEEQEDIEFH